MRFLVPLLIVTLLFGCKSNPNSEAISKIDSLLVEANKASSDLSQFNPEDVKWMVDTINFDVKFIQQEFTDTLNLVLATKIDAYYRNVRSIEKYRAAYKAQRKDVDFTIEQLNDMKADLQSGIMDSSGFKMYIGAETEAVNRMKESNSGLKEWNDNILKSYNTFKSPIDSLIKTIKDKAGY